MFDDIEVGVQYYRISVDQLADLLDMHTSLSDLLCDAFRYKAKKIPALDNYVFAPVDLIDTIEENDWVLFNTDSMIYHFRTSTQPGWDM
ncbi:MAG: hypothetical protein IKO68_01215 [Oscillospiraceae bacterium]|nr:hypothetical protein [Oscillospiraceae bacterium]